VCSHSHAESIEVQHDSESKESLCTQLTVANDFSLRGVGSSTCLWTVPRAQALLRGRAWVVRAVRLRALPFFLVQHGCLRVGAGRCGLAAVVGGGVRCFVGVNVSSSRTNPLFIAPPPALPTLLHYSRSALPTLLHYSCMTIAQYTTPLPNPPFCMLYTIR